MSGHIAALPKPIQRDIVPEGDTAHIKTTTWVMGEEEDTPITRLIFRLENGDMEATAAKLKTVLQTMSDSGRTKLAIA